MKVRAAAAMALVPLAKATLVDASYQANWQRPPATNKFRHRRNA